MRRYRRNFELTHPAPLPLEAVRTIADRSILGIVANPKTHEPALAVTDGEFVGLRSLRARELFKSFGRGYYESSQSEPSELTGLPRSHTPDGVTVKGEGWGTCLYTALALGAYQVDNKRAAIEMYGKGAGICSWTEDRSSEADRWWGAASRRGLTESETHTDTEKEEYVKLKPSARELNECLDVDGTITYVNDLDVDIERETEKSVDQYEYLSAWNHDLVVCELDLEVPAGLAADQCLPFVWKSLLNEPDRLGDVNPDALLALDVRLLDLDGINLLSLSYLATDLGDAAVDDLHERWKLQLDPGERSAQGRLFRANQAGLRSVEGARARTAWAELADLPD